MANKLLEILRKYRNVLAAGALVALGAAIGGPIGMTIMYGLGTAIGAAVAYRRASKAGASWPKKIFAGMLGAAAGSIITPAIYAIGAIISALAGIGVIGGLVSAFAGGTAAAVSANKVANNISQKAEITANIARPQIQPAVQERKEQEQVKQQQKKLSIPGHLKNTLKNLGMKLLGKGTKPPKSKTTPKKDNTEKKEMDL